MAYTNDVFISYSHVDAAWADKLYNSLTAAGLRAYLDTVRLKGGEFWEQSLAKQVNVSRNLIVLRSNASKGSDWVGREVGLFDGFTLSDPQRRLIAINLEGEDTSRASVQQINQLRDAKLYAAGIGQVDPNVWADTLRAVRMAIEDNDDALKIAVAVLTLPKADVAAMDPRTLTEITEKLGLDTNAVLQRYPGSRLEWRPFGEAKSISTIIDELIAGLPSGGPRNLRWRWRPAPEELWDADRIDQAVLDVVNAPLSLVVVDSLVMAHPAVYRMMNQLRDFLKRSVTSWLIFPPKASDASLLAYRTAVRKWSSPLLREYFEPPIPPDLTAPQFGVHCGDADELERLVRLAAGAYLARTEGAPKAGFTEFRT